MAAKDIRRVLASGMLTLLVGIIAGCRQASDTVDRQFVRSPESISFAQAYTRATEPTGCLDHSSLELFKNLPVPGARSDVRLSNDIVLHDCQTLVEDGGVWGNEYKTTAGVYVLSDLASISDADFLRPDSARRVALIAYSGTKKMKSLDLPQLTVSVPSMVLCLYVGVHTNTDSSDDGNWFAAYGDCATYGDWRTDVPSEQQLRVARRFPQGSDAVPAAASWQWRKDKTLIGVRCGSAWCVIGKEVPVAESVDKGESVRRWGWEDEQFLAEFDKDKLKLSKIRARIVPDTVITKYATLEEMPKDVFLPFATVFLSGNSEKYDTLGLTKGKNTIALRYKPTASAEKQWMLKVISSEGLTVYRTVEYKPLNPNRPPSGTARWKWLPDDERGWGSCPAGCCEAGGRHSCMNQPGGCEN
ncbi:MAG: hypothetical protein ACREQV_26250 [Candidatus Binatia bacterium]